MAKFEFEPWKNAPHQSAVCQAPNVPDPPCRFCEHWNPIYIFDDNGGNRGVRLCHHFKEQTRDFSCYAAKEVESIEVRVDVRKKLAVVEAKLEKAEQAEKERAAEVRDLVEQRNRVADERDEAREQLASSRGVVSHAYAQIEKAHIGGKNLGDCIHALMLQRDELMRERNDALEKLAEVAKKRGDVSADRARWYLAPLVGQGWRRMAKFAIPASKLRAHPESFRVLFSYMIVCDATYDFARNEVVYTALSPLFPPAPERDQLRVYGGVSDADGDWWLEGIPEPQSAESVESADGSESSEVPPQ